MRNHRLHEQLYLIMSSTTPLTYTSEPSPWFSLEFSNVFLNSLAIAVLVTLISFQTTGIIFDTILGFKERSAAPIKSLHTLLLVRQSSPLAVLTNLLRIDPLTRFYYRGDIPSDTRILREQTSIRTTTTIKLLLLLAVAPVINVLSIVLTLEKTNDLTFAEAGVKGIQLGINEDLRITSFTPITSRCSRTEIATKQGDDPLADFMLCSNVPGVRPNPEETPVRGQVAVFVAQSVVYVIQVQIGTFTMQSSVRATIRSEDQNYVPRTKISNSSAEPFVDLGMSLIAPHCGSTVEQARDEFVRHSLMGQAEVNMTFVRAKWIPCASKGDPEAIIGGMEDVLQKLVKYITLVNADRLDIVKEGHGVYATESENFFNGSDLPFLSRRTRNSGLLVLVLISGAAVLLRIFTILCWNNDIEEGIDLVVKNTLGMKCCDSLLREGDRSLGYNKKFQNDHVAHYGLSRRGMAEVQQFHGGILGADNMIQYEDDRFTASTSDESAFF